MEKIREETVRMLIDSSKRDKMRRIIAQLKATDDMSKPFNYQLGKSHNSWLDMIVLGSGDSLGTIEKYLDESLYKQKKRG